MSAPAALSPVLAAFGLGIGLASAPGPVQVVLVTESIRGGIGRGVRALAGVHLTFLALLLVLGLGLTVTPPGGLLLRALEVAGGIFLVWLALDGIRSGHRARPQSEDRPRLPAAARGSLSILLNPGGWVFLAAVASPLLATAVRLEGVAGSVAAALALVLGAALGDAGVVVLGSAGLRRVGERRSLWVLRALAVLLAALGGALVVRGIAG
jgi:threonine/homoserine/homoserine lactone efflux protein